MTDLEDRFARAVRKSWDVRREQTDRQVASGTVDAGTRGAVTGGKHLADFTEMLYDLFIDAGLHESNVRLSGAITLPGYYRPTKRWDLVADVDGELVAAIEMKSMVGSVGKNINNRAEEAIGNAVDLRAAWRRGAFGAIEPWLGFVMLLGEDEDITETRVISANRFKIDDEFTDTSYKDRFALLCRRMVNDGLYNAGCFVTSTEDPAHPIDQPDPTLTINAFAEAIYARVKAFTDR